MNFSRLLKLQQNTRNLILIIVTPIVLALLSTLIYILITPVGISRAEFCKELIEKYRITTVDSADSPRHFVDVPRNSKYFIYIETAYQKGLIKPIKKNAFYPNLVISKEDRILTEKITGRLNKISMEKLISKKYLWMTPELDKFSISDKREASPTFPVLKRVPSRSKITKPKVKLKPNANLISSIPAWFVNSNKAVITGTGDFILADSRGVGIISLKKGVNVQLAYSNGVYIAQIKDGKAYSSKKEFKLIPKGASLMEIISYNDKSYAGRVKYNVFRGNIITQYSPRSKKVWVVNELSIEDYLRGIAEASPGDNIEYLKTLTVAARSYATYYLIAGGKHKGEPFHLKNSRLGNGNDQIYAGYGFESIISNMSKAADLTKGDIVTYGGKVIWTPFSHGTNGKTKSAKDGFGRNDMPWCQSVKDPHGYISNWATLPGNHMVGLSAVGARGFIEKENRNYKWILNYYFKNIKITKPEIKKKLKVSIYGFNLQ